jgi:hypothetical protein
MKRKFGLCVKNKGYAASLEMRKVYRVLSDAEALKSGMLRVIDESGEDYLYPEEFFVILDLPKEAQRLAWSSTPAPA